MTMKYFVTTMLVIIAYTMTLTLILTVAFARPDMPWDYISGPGVVFVILELCVLGAGAAGMEKG